VNIKRILGGLGLVILLLGGAAYHFLFGYVVVEHIEGPITLLQRQNILDQIGANIVVFESLEETIVVDTQLAPLSSSTRSRVETVSKAPITKVIVTHWHPDHSGGISAFSSDTDVIAHQNVLHRLSSPQQGFGLTRPGSQHEFAARSASGLPNKTVETQLQFPVGKTIVELVHFPKAHTDGDLAVFFRDSEIVATGDLIWPKSFPFVDVHNGGSISGLESALREIIAQSKPAYRFIPGHGATLTFDEVVDYLEMLSQTRFWVESQLDEGKSVEQVKEMGLPVKWTQWASPLVPSVVWIQMIHDSRTMPTQAVVSK
jgi:cyclase